MHRIILLAFLFIKTTGLFCQGVDKSQSPKKLNKRFDDWNKGKVLFKNGDTLNCEFTYSPLVPGGLLKIKENQSIKTYTPDLLDGFSYFENGTERKFMSLSGGRTSRLFEVLFEYQTFSLLGELAIIINKTRDGDSNYTVSSVSGKYNNYILDVQNWKYYWRNKKSLLFLMRDRENEIKAFMKLHNIRLKRTDDYINVIVEYTGMKEKNGAFRN